MQSITQCSFVCLTDWSLTTFHHIKGYIMSYTVKIVKVVTVWWWWYKTKNNNAKLKILWKHQNSSYELFCLKVNGSWSNWSLWRLTPRHTHHLDTVQLVWKRKKQATLVDTARKRGGLLYTGPGTTQAKLPASRFARFLSPARGRRWHRK